MKRRALLASAGSSLAATSGCLLFTGETDEDESTPTDGGTPTTTESGPQSPTPVTPTPDVSVASAIQQHGFVMTSDDSISVVDAATQYLVLEVDVEEGAYARQDLTLVIGSSREEPTRIGSFYRTDWAEDEWYERGRERGLLVFELPEEMGSAPPTLQWPSGEWRPGKTLLRRITSSRPAMSASLAVPEASDGSTEKTVRVDVTNEGDVQGRYLAGVNRVGPAVAYTPVGRVSGLLGAGESETFLLADDWSEYPSETDRGDGERDVTYHLEDGGEGDRLEITVEE